MSAASRTTATGTTESGGSALPDPVLVARSISAGYGGGLAVRDLDLELRAGEITLLSGANGAGKTTTLSVLAGLLAPTSGTITMHGRPAPRGLSARARSGMGLVTEQRSIFMDLTVRENLRLSRGGVTAALELFPELEGRLTLRSGLMSGGEQQMLALARILTSRPSVVLADELSQGLAPIVTKRLVAALRQAADVGAAILLVEQQIATAIRTVDRVYVLRRGVMAWSGSSDEYQHWDGEVQSLYLE